MPYIQSGRFVAKNTSIPIDQIRRVDSGMSMTGQVCCGLILLMLVGVMRGAGTLSGAEWAGPIIVLLVCAGGVLESGWQVKMGTDHKTYKVNGSWSEIQSMKEELREVIGVTL
jgi:hypothetical protein